jgi:hypothetical protein
MSLAKNKNKVVLQDAVAFYGRRKQGELEFRVPVLPDCLSWRDGLIHISWRQIHLWLSFVDEPRRAAQRWEKLLGHLPDRSSVGGLIYYIDKISYGAIPFVRKEICEPGGSAGAAYFGSAPQDSWRLPRGSRGSGAGLLVALTCRARALCGEHGCPLHNSRASNIDRIKRR